MTAVVRSFSFESHRLRVRPRNQTYPPGARDDPNVTAMRYTAGGAAPDGALTPESPALSSEVLRAMFLHKLKTALLVACIAILLAGGGVTDSLHARSSPDAEPPSPDEAPGERATHGERPADKPVATATHAVTISRPMRREATPYQDYDGRLEALRAVKVRPGVSGFVLKICFKAGAEVKQGDALFELDSREPQLALKKAQTELALAQAIKKESDASRRSATLPEDCDKYVEKVAATNAAVATARLEVTRARLALEATKITAPMSGQVGRPLVEPRTLVFRGPDRATLLTTVTSLDPIGLLFDMDELSFLRYQRLLREKQVKGLGSPLRVQLADEGGFPREGTLDSFEDHVSAATGTVRVRGSLPNPGRLLLPGMFARVRMAVGPRRAVLEVPEAAVLSDQGKKYVLVVNDQSVVERRYVTTGPIDNGMRIVEKGLRDEDRVVTAGLGGLHPGDPVEPRRKDTPER